MVTETMNFQEMVDFMNQQPEWVGIPLLKNVSVASKAQNDLLDVSDEIKEKRGQIRTLESRLYSLEREKSELEEVIWRDRANNERALVQLLRDKFMRDESIRAELEARTSEQESEIERLTKRLDQEMKFREEAFRSADALRQEIKQLEERVVADEQNIGRLHDIEDQLHCELSSLQSQSADDSKVIAELRERERVLTAELEGAEHRTQALEEQHQRDGEMMVEMRDRERNLLGELEATRTEARLLDERGIGDEQQIASLKENLKNLQMDNDNLHSQNVAFEAKLNEDVSTIETLRDSESKLRRKLRVLDDVSEEVERLRGELEKHRKANRETNLSMVSNSPERPTRRVTYSDTQTTRRFVRSPSPGGGQSSVRNSSPTHVEHTTYTRHTTDGSPRTSIMGRDDIQPTRYSSRRFSSSGAGSRETTTRYDSSRHVVRHSAANTLTSPPRSPGTSTRLSRSFSTSAMRHGQ
eukprot:TRINITY_DN20529_c0_g1_i1.p1 TRINITY_DN20529_c0_g1~~TRINITY_DN20529_c0_g1_i1.p1  ORF type:complete len:491 (-),score=53.87 TRINITY_DN20529_c0_g1_i1:280-1686(-)